MTVSKISRGNLTFDVIESGPQDGQPVLLLHGFPQHADSWDAVVPRLTGAGYRTLAMNQRGYSPGARPTGRAAYRIPELVADTVAVIDHYGGPVHVVGHDWGAAVAWSLAAAHPDKVRTLSALSVPHPGAFFRAMLASPQPLRSWYMAFFQLPWLPELLLRRWLVTMLIRFGQSPEAARRDARNMRDRGALTSALNWYRAMPLVSPKRASVPVRRPTLYIWSDGDSALDRWGAERTERYVQAPYQFETLAGVSHWIPDQAPEELAALLLSHFKRWAD